MRQSKDLKYIIIDDEPALFSTELTHALMARGEKSYNGKIVSSAGFCTIAFDAVTRKFKARCYGESESLEIKSDPTRDQVLIEEFLNY